MSVDEVKLRGIVERGFSGKRFEQEVREVMRDDSAPLNKYDRLTALIDEASALIAPATPCRKGCGNCCKIAVSISEEEARRIAQHTGREMKGGQVGISKELVEQLERNTDKYYGVRCPFLGKSDECTIYVVRPAACRAYHSLHDTALECTPAASRDLAPTIPTVNLQSALFATATLGVGESYGDIRDFFEAEAAVEAIR